METTFQILNKFSWCMFVIYHFAHYIWVTCHLNLMIISGPKIFCLSEFTDITLLYNPLSDMLSLAICCRTKIYCTL